MDSGLVMSSSNASSVTTGGNLWRNKHSTKNIYYASSCSSKSSQHKRKTRIDYNILRTQQLRLYHHYKCIEGWSIYQEINRKYIVKAIPRLSFDYEPRASDPKIIWDSIKTFFAAFYLFCYPYTVIGQTLNTVSVSFLAVKTLSDISPLFFVGMLQVLVPYLFMDIYINGVNQLFDFKIDKINKPYLPLTSGKLSFTTGVIITALSLILSLGLGWATGSWPLIWSLILCGSLWTAYSINVPLLRWKGNPLLAAMCIFATWAFIFPITFFLHFQTFVLKRPAIFPRSLVLFAIFSGIYSLGIALFKDIPDIEGDKKFGIYSFSARLGQKRVFWICVSLFEMAFGVSLIGGAMSSSYLWIKIVTGLGHAVLASVLWYHAKSLDLRSKSSIGAFYMLLWKLWYATYFLMPLIR